MVSYCDRALYQIMVWKGFGFLVIFPGKVLFGIATELLIGSFTTVNMDHGVKRNAYEAWVRHFGVELRIGFATGAGVAWVWLDACPRIWVMEFPKKGGNIIKRKKKTYLPFLNPTANRNCKLD